jgi:CHAT domain-containing protein/Tfp pilus assembly protein PilF
MTNRNKHRSILFHRRGRVVNQNSANFLTLFLLFSTAPVVPSHQTFGRNPGLIQQSTQQPRDAGNRTSDENDVRVLEPSEPIKRDLAVGQQHGYQVRLGADQFLKAAVEQDGIDVVVQVSGPDGKQILEFDFESGLRSREEVSLVAEVAGDYLLLVRSTRATAPPGRYEIRIEELRAATENERALYDAQKLFQESIKLLGARKYDEAIRSSEQALAIRERVLGADHREVAFVIKLQGNAFFYKDDDAKAEMLYKRALTIWEKVLEPEHPQVASILNNLAVLYWLKGDYAKPEPLYRRALAIRERELGAEHPEVAYTLDNLAILYKDKGDYANAEPLYERALAILEKVLGPEHPGIAKTVDNLAILNSVKGNYARAELLHRRALAILEKALGPEHPRIAFYIMNLAILYFYKGDYARAESLHQRALSIIEKSLGPEDPSVARSLYNLAGVYYAMGDYTSAERLHERALTIFEKALGPQYEEVADSLNQLALICAGRGDLAKAESLYQRALTIQEKALGLEHPKIAMTLNNLATLHGSKGEYAKADQLYQRALAIREKTLGPEHPDVADSLNNVAMLAVNKGEYVKAEPLYERALEILRKALGPGQPKVAKTLNDIAALYIAKGDPSRAVAVQSRANVITENNLAFNLAIGTERQKRAYLVTLSEQVAQTLSLHLHHLPHDLTARNLAATIILQRKGRALDAASENLNALRSRFSTEDQALLDRLIDTRSQFARLVLGGPQKMLPEQYREQIKALEDRAEQYEADISRRSSEFRAQSLPVTLAAVQAAIPPDAVLIEFASYHPFNARAVKDDQVYSQPRYVAYVLRRHGEIQWKEFGDAKSIDDAIAAFRAALSDPKRRDVKRLARALDEQVMQSLRPLLGDAQQILISPDGDLNLIPFEALVDEQGRYLIERYSFNYLTSGRDLLRLQVERGSKSAPLVIADPMFGARDQLAKADVAQQKPPARRRLRQSVTTGSDLSGVYFAPLMGAELEAREIKSLFPEARVLVGEEATEASLKQAVAPRILHIATHGFFLEDRPIKIEGARGLNLMRDDGDLGRLSANMKIENPLLRSGLALAGANQRTGRDDDGILTALEATGLNLWGTQLVVLSACDTGVGVVRTGEGVYGLRRALVLAGSETQVMSLWPVRDYATQRLMKAFYAGLKQGQGRGEALRNVKLMTMRRRGTEHPFYWAGFIQSGKWTELDDKR